MGLCPLGAWKCPIGWQIARVGSAGPPYSTSCLLGFADSSRVLVDRRAPSTSCLLTSVAGHLVPYLSPQAPCLQSPLLSSVLCPWSCLFSSARVHLHPSVFSPALVICTGQQEPHPPHLFCFHLFPAPVLLGLLSWVSLSTPSHQFVVLSLGHFFPAPLSQCTGTLVTHPLSAVKLVLLEPFWALLSGTSLTLCSLRSLGLSAAAGHVSAQFSLDGGQRPCPSCP